MQQFSIRPIFFVFIFFLSSCKTANKIFSTNKTPHEQYSNRLTEAKLHTTAFGKAWFAAAQKALQQPDIIQLPYKETGYFAAERPSSFGYRFNARRGEKISIAINIDTLHPFLLFADLWRYDTIQPRFLKAADTASLKMAYEVEDEGTYILRIQPELLHSGQYTVVISATGSLAFPVPAESNPRIGSFWGAARDAGARKHEGIDIFGKFRTPVIAAADGYISSTKENKLGGKVVFLRPVNKDFTLYYAHLDSQIAREGQKVKTGDVVGLMGNTGNARTTPTHLHFGIYTNAGAIDPLPFIDKQNEEPANITAAINNVGNFVRNNKSTSLFSSPSAKANLIEKVPVGTALLVIAATSQWYKIKLPNGKEGFINDNNIALQQPPLLNYTLFSDVLLLDDPIVSSSPKKLIRANTSLPVYGVYQSWYLVKADGLYGWIKK